MRQLFLKFWNDDSGAIISTEWVLVVAIMIFGVIPGLVAVRNAVSASQATIGNALLTITPSFSFEGFAIVGSPSGGTIAVVNGYSFSTTSATMFKSASVAGAGGSYSYVSPAP